MNSISSYRVLAYDVLDSQTARMTVRVPNRTRNESLKALAAQLKVLTIVARSDRTVREDAYTQDVNVVVARKQVTKPATEVNKMRMMTVAANMFMDNSDNSVWEENGGVLVRRDNIETSEQLEKVLAAVCPIHQRSSGDGIAAQRILASSTVEKGSVESGMYAVYHENGQLYDGFIVALSNDEQEAIVLPRPDDYNNPYAHTRISISHIVESYDLASVTTEVPTLPASEKHIATAASTSLNAALAYYKKIYGYNREYFAKFAAMLRSRGAYA